MQRMDIIYNVLYQYKPHKLETEAADQVLTIIIIIIINDTISIYITVLIIIIINDTISISLYYCTG